MIDTVCAICKAHRSPGTGCQVLSWIERKAVMAIRITTADLTETDRKAAGVLLSHYPVVGLETLAEVSAKPVINTRPIDRSLRQVARFRSLTEIIEVL